MALNYVCNIFNFKKKSISYRFQRYNYNQYINDSTEK